MKRNFFWIFVLFIVTLTGCGKSVSSPKEVIIDGTLVTYNEQVPSKVEKYVHRVEGNKTSVQVSMEKSGLNENFILANEEGKIREIRVVDRRAKTFNNISVGDKVTVLEKKYQHIDKKLSHAYTVFFDGTNDVELSDIPNDSTDNMLIVYYLDNDVIEKIDIYDLFYMKIMK